MKVEFDIDMKDTDPRIVGAFVAATSVKIVKHIISTNGAPRREDVTDQTGRRCGYWEVKKN
jgi:hypothetical protein